MRQFTFEKSFTKYEYKVLEKKVGEELPSELFNILENYAGIPIKERLYFSKFSSKKLLLVSFNRFSEIYSYFEDIEEELSLSDFKNIKLISIASEEGGWRFCMSTEKDNPIYIFKNNYSGNRAFEKIADSLEEFINGLKEPSEEDLV